MDPTGGDGGPGDVTAGDASSPAFAIHSRIDDQIDARMRDDSGPSGDDVPVLAEGSTPSRKLKDTSESPPSPSFGRAR